MLLRLFPTRRRGRTQIGQHLLGTVREPGGPRVVIARDPGAGADMALVPPTFSLFSRISTEAPPTRAASAAESAAAPEPTTITSGEVSVVTGVGGGLVRVSMAPDYDTKSLLGIGASFDPARSGCIEGRTPFMQQLAP